MPPHTTRSVVIRQAPAVVPLVEEARELAVFAPKEEVLSGLRNGTLTDKYEKATEDAYHNAMRLNQHDAIFTAPRASLSDRGGQTS